MTGTGNVPVDQVCHTRDTRSREACSRASLSHTRRFPGRNCLTITDFGVGGYNGGVAGVPLSFRLRRAVGDETPAHPVASGSWSVLPALPATSAQVADTLLGWISRHLRVKSLSACHRPGYSGAGRTAWGLQRTGSPFPKIRDGQLF